MSKSRRSVALPIAAAALLLGAAPLTAQETPPPAEQVIERYVEAIGGRDRVLTPRSSHSVGTVEVPAAGMTGTIEVLNAGPRAMVTRATIAGFGEQNIGILDDVAWSMDSMSGARLLEGRERDELVEASKPGIAARQAEHFTTRESIGFSEYGGERCVEVRLVFHSGREVFDCYSVETGLLIGNRGMRETGMGSIEVRQHMRDYREFDGVRMPTHIVQSMMGIEQHMRLESVRFGTVERSDIEMPAHVRALIGGE
jgi:hypothetical protein